MIVLKGTIQDGQVVLPQKANVPNGTEVTVLTHESGTTLGVPDHEWPTDKEGIARLVAHMQEVEPFEMTAAEEAELRAWRQKVKEFTLANQEKVIEGLFE
jgi:hypothetical protein